MPPAEQLTEEPHQVSFTRRSGVLLTWRRGLLLLLLLAACLLATGLLVHHLGTPADGAPSEARAAPVVSDETTAADRPAPDIRLPRHLVPLAYQLRTLPLFEEGNFSFSGEVTVTLRADAAGDNVTLHVSQLIVSDDSVAVTDVTDDRQVPVVRLVHDVEREFLVVVLAEPVVPGHNYSVNVMFSGTLNDKLAGFYRSSYTTSEGEKRWMAVTQMAPTDARKVFPCLDEPALKATFEITLGRHKNMTAISNMPLSTTEPNPEKTDFVWDTFEKSMPMSTYLVAFVVSDMVARESDPSLSDTRFRVWSRAEAEEQTKYAGKIGPAILEYYEDFFKTDFPLPKQDMAAMPDFPFRGMENWGLILYSEAALLLDPEVTSAASKQALTQVVAHELAHMWFGDLVTPAWWNDIWLNEGFARYVEMLGTHKVKPSWLVPDQMVTRVTQEVMSVDSLRSSRPVSIDVNSSDDIDQMFDKISYQKGASIIRMLDKMLTRETLREALSNYLRAMQYRAATQDDLWRFLTEQAHRDGTLPDDVTVKQVMDTWTLQMGFPLVTVVRNYGKRSAQMTQNRFLLDGIDNSTDYLWWIPLTFTTKTKAGFDTTQPSHWMKKERQLSINDVAHGEDWMILNVQQMGFFKVNYDERNWKMITGQLQQNHSAFHVINRAQLVDDALDLGRAGQLSYSTALSLVSYLERERDFLPWDAAFNNLGFLNTQLRRTAGYGAFQKFVLKLIGPLYARIGFEERPSDSHIDHLTRNHVVVWACSMGHPDCISKAVNMFKRWMEDPDNASIVPANIRNSVFCTALHDGGLTEWEFVWRRFNESNVESEKEEMLKALACTEETVLINKLLSWLITPDSGLRVQHGNLVFKSVASNPAGGDLAWSFMRENSKEIVERYSSALFLLPRFIAALKDSLNTALQLEQLRQFSTENAHILSGASREIRQVLEHVFASVSWMDGKSDQVVRWLEDHIS
ncbi:aminopeptidase N-like [Amphibalanus amphitrite]|uniref:aminopeptidase N-like n=1 Tax=Amphibalanus amphitrite TaxID=1232801 RepID=UPI001C912E69|nr:aminopeptidase N-like [Amphibalanus amphitrite]